MSHYKDQSEVAPRLHRAPENIEIELDELRGTVVEFEELANRIAGAGPPTEQKAPNSIAAVPCVAERLQGAAARIADYRRRITDASARIDAVI